jgi:hypothetical protein
MTDFGLPPTMAVRATNVKLLSGEVRGIHALSLVKDFGDPAIKSVYRIPAFPVDLWLTFETEHGVVIRSPLVNDSFERFYWHEDGQPIYYNTKARIAAGNTGANAPFLLGVPQPANAPDVTPAGGTANTVTRVYVYTWVSSFGEEGPPSLPTTATTFDDATWTIDNFDVAVPDAAQRDITHINIYRTITSASGNADYYFVAQIPIATLSYADSALDITVAARGQIMESTFWFPPLADLTGIVEFPGGIILGWKGNTLHMSVPYRPHAWSPLFQVSASHPIVGVGVAGNTAVLATEGMPAAVTMTTPETASLQKIEAAEPCLERGSVVGSPEGVYYASQNGLMVFGPSGFQNITKDIVSKEEWLTRYVPSQTNACRYQTQYIGLSQPGKGYVLDSTDLRVGFVELAGLSGASMIQNDVWSGEVYLVAAGQVFKWDDAATGQLLWRWASKRFQFPYEINIGACRLFTHKEGFGDLAPIPVDAVLGTFTPPLTPGDGAPETVVGVVPAWAAFLLRVYVDGQACVERYVWSNETISLPSGFKSDDWQFEILGARPLVKFEFAETAKELAEV